LLIAQDRVKNTKEIKIITTGSAEETVGFGRQFGSKLGSGDIIALYGELGTGKTQVVKGICSALGVKEVVNSPTFIIVNEYSSYKIPFIFHFDLYRMRTTQEVIDIGFEDYFIRNGLIMIEWPELIKNILPSKTKNIYLSYNGNNENSRIIKFDTLT
jgi:tRNA threonylcarbamoyladenosine biosynthesis protein TsaE